MVRLERVTVSLGGRRIVERISADLAGGVTGLIGPNGAGKSTLVRAIAGLVPSEGTILIDGTSIGSMPLRDRAKRIAYLPQGQAVHWPLTVER